MSSEARTEALTSQVSTADTVKRYSVWIATAAILTSLPAILSSGTALTTMSLMGIMIVFSLSYNMLLGQTGLLSFGHAVYYGLGGFFTVHAMNGFGGKALAIPLPLIPFVGGVTGLMFGIIFGSVSTRRAGTSFAMITLGLGELVASASPILPTFFGGEEGISTNRTTLPAFFGLRFGSQLETYYLIAAWCFVCAALMFAFTRTPLGRMSMAVRINPERTEFNGYSAAMVRFFVFCVSSFFAGVAGSLAAVNFELMTVASISARQSGTVLLMTFVGGVEHFIGPILGAILVVFLQSFLSDLTDAWMLYFGLLFVAVVVFAPGGLAGLIMLHAPLVRRSRLHRIIPYYAVMLLPIALGLVGAAGLVGMARILWANNSNATVHFLGVECHAGNPLAWGAAVLLMFAGLWLGRLWASRVSKVFVLLGHEPPKQVGR